jgi:hypothetical protein
VRAQQQQQWRLLLLQQRLRWLDRSRGAGLPPRATAATRNGPEIHSDSCGYRYTVRLHPLTRTASRTAAAAAEGKSSHGAREIVSTGPGIGTRGSSSRRWATTSRGKARGPATVHTATVTQQKRALRDRVTEARVHTARARSWAHSPAGGMPGSSSSLCRCCVTTCGSKMQTAHPWPSGTHTTAGDESAHCARARPRAHGPAGSTHSSSSLCRHCATTGGARAHTACGRDCVRVVHVICLYYTCMN